MSSKSDIGEKQKEMSNNVVNKNVQSILFPLNLMQNIMFCPKYHIKNNIIGPIGLIHNLVALVGTGTFIYAFFYRLYILYIEKNKEGYLYLQYVLSMFDCGYYTLGLGMIFISGIFNTESFISFVLVFQKIHRFLNDKKKSKH